MEEDKSRDNCPKCGREYDEIDHDFQICSKCGWDAQTNKPAAIRSPGPKDFDCGEANIVTEEWY